MKFHYKENNGEFILEDLDNPGVVRGGPVSGVVVIENIVTGTIFTNVEPETKEERKANIRANK